MMSSKAFLFALVLGVSACGGDDYEVSSGALALDAERAPLVVFLVRHAEKETGSDPALTREGIRRAKALSEILRRDAHIEGVYSTNYKRTRQTARPTSDAFGVDLNLYDPYDLSGLASMLQEKGGNHLVVGHSNTTTDAVELLGGEPGGDISENEYDRLYMITMDYSTGRVRTDLSRYH